MHHPRLAIPVVIAVSQLPRYMRSIRNIMQLDSHGVLYFNLFLVFHMLALSIVATVRSIVPCEHKYVYGRITNVISAVRALCTHYV